MKRGEASRYYYCVENSNLDGPDFTLAETELVLKHAELHAQCATEAGVAPEPRPMRAVLHLAKSMAADRPARSHGRRWTGCGAALTPVTTQALRHAGIVAS